MSTPKRRPYKGAAERRARVIQILQTGAQPKEIAATLAMNNGSVHRLLVRMGCKSFWLTPEEQELLKTQREGVPLT